MISIYVQISALDSILGKEKIKENLFVQYPLRMLIYFWPLALVSHSCFIWPSSRLALALITNLLWPLINQKLLLLEWNAKVTAPEDWHSEQSESKWPLVVKSQKTQKEEISTQRSKSVAWPLSERWTVNRGSGYGADSGQGSGK